VRVVLVNHFGLRNSPGLRHFSDCQGQFAVSAGDFIIAARKTRSNSVYEMNSRLVQPGMQEALDKTPLED
jgi:hypothetical protein